MKFTLFHADCLEIPGNCTYPHKVEVTGKDALLQAVTHDYVCAEYQGNYRSNENFIGSDCLPVDCDNDHSDEPEEWVYPSDVANAFPGVAFAVHYSRNHMKEKGGKVPRPKFHVFFAIDRISDPGQYSEMKKLVKRIYGMFLTGQSPFQIAQTLTKECIPSPGGKDHWNPSNIRSILTNEKYKGDALLQKTYTVDFLTKKKKVNEGEIPQYYVRDNHEAIIDPETFEMVQTLMSTRTKGRNRRSSVSIFSSKVKCGDCGSWYGPKVWHSNDPYRKVIWQCNHKFEGQKCTTPTFTEDEIKELFLRAANQVIDQKEQFISVYEQVLAKSLNTTALEYELSKLEAEINIAAELIEECIRENAHVALDQAEYQKRYDGLVARFDKAKAKHIELTDIIAEHTTRKHQIESYLKELRDREPLTEFRDSDWLAMVDFITIHNIDDIQVTFKDGTEIKA